jgi:HrpA-like RNA helicase
MESLLVVPISKVQAI